MADKAINFTITANELLALKEYGGQRLSTGDKIVYQVLCSHLYGKKFCYPSIKTIAEEAGLADRSVRRSLVRLEEAGLIKTFERVENGVQKSNKYFVKSILTQAKIETSNLSSKTSQNNLSEQKMSGVTNCPTKNKKTYKPCIYSTNSTSEKKVESVEHTNKDVRFEIIESDKSYQMTIDQDIYALVKKYYFTILRTKKDEYMINGLKVSKAQVTECLESLTYKEILSVVQNVMTMTRRKGYVIKSEFGYFLKLFWNIKHPSEKMVSIVKEDAKLGRTKLETPSTKNSFNNFHQRNYDFDELEKMLLGVSV